MSMTPIAGEEQDANQALRDALVAYLSSGETDEEARVRLEELPGGTAVLDKLARIRAMQRCFSGESGLVEEYLERKWEEIEAEQRRDAGRLG